MTTMVGTITAGSRGMVHTNAAECSAVHEQRVNVAKNLALFLAAPFVGLAYIVALPIVVCAVLMGARIRK